MLRSSLTNLKALSKNLIIVIGMWRVKKVENESERIEHT